MSIQKLIERQMQWSLILLKYNFMIKYLPRKKNVRVDTLSWREQDLPKGLIDEREQHRTMQLIKPWMLPCTSKLEQRLTFAALVATKEVNIEGL